MHDRSGYKAALLSALLLGFSSASPAEALDTSGLRAARPGIENLEKLEAQMRANPHFLDSYFTYAQMAAKLGEYKKAATAYEHMLSVNSSLARVKLDLGVTYSKMGRFEEAKALLTDVLARDVPEKVRHNIETVLAKIEEASKEHFYTGSVALGVHHDSNGNSAAESGSVTVFDTSIPLGEAQKAQEDYQMFASASLSHRYRHRDPLAEGLKLQWNSSFSAYQNEQEHFDELNIKLLVLRTGPTFELPEINAKVNLTGGYTHIVLNNHSYLRIYTGELGAEHVLENGIRLTGALTREFRDFINSPTVFTFSDRTGPADQARIGMGYAIGEQDYVDGGLTLRREDTKRAFYDNYQLTPTVGWTRQWGEGIFSRLQAYYKGSLYDGADPLISTRRRRDLEKSIGLTLGKSFEDGLILTVGWQYRDVNSSVQNYAYDNHRLSTTLSLRF